MKSGLKVILSSSYNGTEIRDKKARRSLMETVVGKIADSPDNNDLNPVHLQFTEQSSELAVLINASNCANHKTEMMTNGYIAGLSLLRVNKA